MKKITQIMIIFGTAGFMLSIIIGYVLAMMSASVIVIWGLMMGNIPDTANIMYLIVLCLSIIIITTISIIIGYRQGKKQDSDKENPKLKILSMICIIVLIIMFLGAAFYVYHRLNLPEYKCSQTSDCQYRPDICMNKEYINQKNIQLLNIENKTCTCQKSKCVIENNT